MLQRSYTAEIGTMITMCLDVLITFNMVCILIFSGFIAAAREHSMRQQKLDSILGLMNENVIS